MIVPAQSVSTCLLHLTAAKDALHKVETFDLHCYYTMIQLDDLANSCMLCSF